MIYIYGIQIIIGSLFLVSESAHYLTISGLSLITAWTVAASLETGVIILATHRDHLSRIVLAGLVALSLGASSLGRVIPLAQSDTATTGQSARLSALDADITRIDAAAKALSDSGQKINHAAMARQLSALVERRAELAATVEAQPVPVIVPVQIGAVVAIRLLLQLVNLICAAKFAGSAKQPAQHPAENLAQIAPKIAPKQTQKNDPNPHRPTIEAGTVDIDGKILTYIQTRGEVARNRLIMSGCVTGKTQDYDAALDRLIQAGAVSVHKNGGGKGAWKYTPAQ